MVEIICQWVRLWASRNVPVPPATKSNVEAYRAGVCEVGYERALVESIIDERCQVVRHR
jgi:hypothetical protein